MKVEADAAEAKPEVDMEYSEEINKTCAGCHADDAWGDKSRKVPQLAGQYSIYLKRQIDNFRNAKRLHDDPRDADIFKSFSDREIRDMLAYLSILDDH